MSIIQTNTSKKSDIILLYTYYIFFLLLLLSYQLIFHYRSVPPSWSKYSAPQRVPNPSGTHSITFIMLSKFPFRILLQIFFIYNTNLQNRQKPTFILGFVNFFSFYIGTYAVRALASYCQVCFLYDNNTLCSLFNTYVVLL